MAIGAAVVGAGYWGPNLIRNFMANRAFRLQYVCDRDVARARDIVGDYSRVEVAADVDDVLSDPRVEAVAIATPASTHFDLARAALEAGKHVIVEKPLAATESEAEKLVDLAHAERRTLMCDHTYCYTPAVNKMRELVASGTLGEIQYVDSVRVNLGLVQPDIDVIWDLAPHDLSILDSILPADNRPTGVSSFAADPVGAGQSCMAYLTMPLAKGGLAHIHVNWLSPVKIRTMVLGGSRRMVVWDDLSSTQRISVYDKGVDLADVADREERSKKLVNYRIGEMVAPALNEREALMGVLDEFAAAITEGREGLTGGEAGLRVVRALDAASRSAARGGALVPIGRAL